MRSIIIEDELPAARRLQKILEQSKYAIEVLTVLDSVESSVHWLKNNPAPDLMFVDIHLADGYSFEIFRQVQMDAPIIFTTAYDEYALKAFELNSIDYLLKPIDEEKLEKSLEKYNTLTSRFQMLELSSLEQLLIGMQQKKHYKNRFLIRQNEQLITVDEKQIAYFVATNKLVLMVTPENRLFPIDFTLDELEQQMDPIKFFRLNRQYLARFDAIAAIHQFFNGKLKIDLHPKQKDEVLVSREKAPIFKRWLEGES
ncbi:MAG: LytR/AlgR family response regulator transcription factor [Candidatus Cyclobacteriaceae bacterium M3_2C_046]